MSPHREEEKEIIQRKEKDRRKDKEGTGYICKMKLGNTCDAGSMWMVRKGEETEKAKQTRYK